MNAFNGTLSASSTLSTRAMLVSLSISQWSGRRLDRDVTAEVNQSHGAEADASRTNKLLLPKSALKDIQSIVSETRNGFLDRTLPWMNDGTRIVNAAAYMQHAQWIGKQRSKFEAAVNDFITAYPGHIIEAQKALGKMFKAEDYPDAEDLRKKFSVSVQVLPVPTSNDFRVEISDAQAEMIRKEIEEHVSAATKSAVSDVYRRVAEVTGRMATKLREYKPATATQKADGLFRNSLVENIRDLVGLMPGLNITGDPNLARIADELQGLARFDADYLRSDANARQNVAEEAQAIYDSVSDFLA